jgi:hypothetical protein
VSPFRSPRDRRHGDIVASIPLPSNAQGKTCRSERVPDEISGMPWFLMHEILG